jgi:hypothetical protein
MYCMYDHCAKLTSIELLCTICAVKRLNVFTFDGLAIHIWVREDRAFGVARSCAAIMTH